MIETLLLNPLVGQRFMKIICNSLLFLIFLSFQIRMSWNIGDNRNLLLQLQSKMGIHQIVLKTPKSCPEKLTLVAVGMQQTPDNEKTESQENSLP